MEIKNDNVFLFNYGDVDFVDEIRGKELNIAPKESKEVSVVVAKYFVGDWDLINEIDKLNEQKRISLRRAGNTPTLKVFFSQKELDEYKQSIQSVVEKQVEEIDTTLVPSGKYTGKSWEDILTDFDKDYWRKTKNIMKNIPGEVKQRMEELLKG